MSGSTIFCELVERCGLSSMFAAHAMARALARVRISADTMTVSDLATVLPEIERAIRPFLPSHAVRDIMSSLYAWADEHRPTRVRMSA